VAILSSEGRDSTGNFIEIPATSVANPVVKPFYTDPLVNAEMLVLILEKLGIQATQEFLDSDAPDEDGDLSRPPRGSCRKLIAIARGSCSTPNGRMSCEPASRFGARWW
jgi:hypothetical protein